MTLLIGSAPGLADYGRTYVRGQEDLDVGTSSLIRIGYCSQGRGFGEVDLVDDAYITVLDLSEVQRRPSKMSEFGTVLKDYEFSTPDYLAPLVQMGGPGGFAIMDFVDDDTGVLAVNDLDCSGSKIMHTSGSFVSTVWDMKDGSYSAGSAYSIAPRVTFPPGKRWISLKRFDSNVRYGNVRRMLVVALEKSGDNAPLFRANKISWTLTKGGVSLVAELHERLDPADYLPGTVVILLVKEARAGYPGSLTNYQVKFAGWLQSTTSVVSANQYDTERYTQLTAIDVGGRLAQLRGTPSGMSRVGTVTTSNQLIGATISRYLWWVHFFHTTASMLADTYLLDNIELYPFTNFWVNGGDWFQIIDKLCKAVGYDFGVDSRGRQLMVQDQLRLPSGSRSITTLYDVGPDDIIKVERVRKPYPTVGVTRATASLTSTTNIEDVVTPVDDLYGVAPGDVEGQGSGDNALDYQSLVYTAQELYDRIGEDHRRSNPYETYLKLYLAHGGDAGIEPAQGTYLNVTLDQETVGWNDDRLENERCRVVQVDFTLNDEEGTMQQVVTVERETTGAPGVRDLVALGSTPAVPEPAPPLALLTAGLGTIAAFMTDGYLSITNDFDSTNPSWTNINLGITGVIQFTVAADSPYYLGTGSEVNGWIIDATHIYRIDDIFGTHSLTTLYTAPADMTLRAMGFERGVLNWGVVVVTRYRITTPGIEESLGALITHDGVTWDFYNWTPYGTDDWIDLTSITPSDFVISPHTPGRVLAWAGAYNNTTSSYDVNPKLYESADYGETLPTASTLAPSFNGNGAIHAPYQSDDESTLYYSSSVGGVTKAVNGVETDVSPLVGAYPVAMNSPYSLKTCDIDMDTVLLAGRWLDSNHSSAQVSTDGAANWTEVFNGTTGGIKVSGCSPAGDDSTAHFWWGTGFIGFNVGTAAMQNKMGIGGTAIHTGARIVNIAGR